MKITLQPSMVSRIIDHTYLRTEKEGASSKEQEKQVHKLVEEAHKGKAFSVCVRESQVARAKMLLDELGSTVKVVSVIGFPCGDEYSTKQKIELLEEVLEKGADEVDMVFNYLQFQQGHHDNVFQDILQISKFSQDHVLKVIFENVYLRQEEKETAYSLAKRAFQESGASLGRRFFKTSTGFAKSSLGKPIGATLEDIRLMKKVAGEDIGLKPSGGIHDLTMANEFFWAAGSPLDENTGSIDPYKFRIGSSTLLLKLY